MDRQACPRNNIIANEIFPINKAFSTDCIISPIKTEITGNDFSQFPFFHLPAIQGKSGDNNSWYPALMEAQAGTPFFSEISSPFPDTVSVFPATVNTAGNQAARLLPQRIVLHPNAHPATLLPLCPKNPVPALSLYQNFPPRYLINSTNP